MYRVSTDGTKAVEFLMKRGADVNAQNNDGLTSLHVENKPLRSVYNTQMIGV